jgi:predicted HTH domain antitoxin
MSKGPTTTLQIPLSKDLETLLGSQPQAIERARELIILGLYQEGRISDGKAAALLGLTRLGFVSLLARKGITYFRLTPDEWEKEAATVQAWNANHA